MRTLKIVSVLITTLSFAIAFGHGEDKLGPNGGYLKMPGPFHTELVQINNKFKVFLTDMEWKNPTVTNSSVEMSYKAANGNRKLTKANCKQEANYFICEFSDKLKFDSGVIVVNATREMQKGNSAEYSLPLRLKDAPAPMDHSRHHGAHVHGAATLNIAFDQKMGKVEFKTAAESVLGFEHQAKTDSEKKKLSETVATFEANIGSMIKFSEAAACVFKKEKIEVVAGASSQSEGHGSHHGENHGSGHDHHQAVHSDFMASFNVECAKDLKGLKVDLDFTQFKGIKDVDVTMLVGDLQKSAKLKRKPVTIEFK